MRLSAKRRRVLGARSAVRPAALMAVSVSTLSMTAFYGSPDAVQELREVLV